VTAYSDHTIGFAASSQRQMATRKVFNEALGVIEQPVMKRQDKATQNQLYFQFAQLVKSGKNQTQALFEITGKKDSGLASKWKTNAVALGFLDKQ
jgi:hypothetical protein